MIYQYTVFQAQDGYAWEKSAPESFSEITPLLMQCESVSHCYYLFHHGNVLRVQKAEKPDSGERPFFVYTVDDFRSEDGIFSADTSNKAWPQVIENFLTDCPPFRRVEVSEEQIPGLLQGFARHLPEKLTAALLVDCNAAQQAKFFHTSHENIRRNTETFRFIRKLPVFREENRLFRALCFREGVPAVSMLAFIALLNTDLSSDFRKNYDKYFDLSLLETAVQYLLLSVDQDFIAEAAAKLDSGIVLCLGIEKEFVRNVIVWYISVYGIHHAEELKQFLHLLACYGLPAELLLPVLQTWEQEYASRTERPLSQKESAVLTYPAFVQAVRENQGCHFVTEELPCEVLDKIYAYILEQEIPVPILEKLFRENAENKNIADLLQFLNQKEHPGKKLKNPEKNLLPACLFWSGLVTPEELENFYGSAESAERMKQDAFYHRMPERIRSLPEFSRSLLFAEKLSEKYRLNTLFQKGKLGKTEKTVLGVSALSFLLMLVSCIRLVTVMLYEC